MASLILRAMSELEEQYQRKANSFWRIFLTVGFATIGGNMFRDLGWLPHPVGFMLFYLLASLVEYWIPPKPPVSFLIWTGKVYLLMVAVLFAIWLIPQWLRVPNKT
jgi:hypothetical protein